MIQQLFNSGAYNSTFWFILAVGAALGLRWRLRHRRAVFALVTCALLIGTAANLFLSLYRAYTVPRDILQDTTSAQEYLEGRPLYHEDMTQRINVALEREGPRGSLLERWPDLRKREQEQLRETLTSHWVQAHPPFMTLFTAVFVKQFGILGTQIAFVVIGLICLGLTLHLLRIEFFPQIGGGTCAIIGIAILGWDPVLTVLRSGQSGLILGALLTLSWFLLRRERPGWAGVAVGAAISLKVVPGMILLVLLLRHRKAFFAALMTLAGIGVFVLAATSFQDHLDYLSTSRGIVYEYAAYSGNLALLGTCARGVRDLGLPFPLARGLWLGCGAALALAFAWRIRRPAVAERVKSDTDIEYALAMTLMPLLSPVAWDHYLVLLVLPLAVLASRILQRGERRELLAFVGLGLVFAVPDASFHWLFGNCVASGQRSLAIWLVLPVRMVGLGILAIWLGNQLSRTPRTASDQRSAPESFPNGLNRFSPSLQMVSLPCRPKHRMLPQIVGPVGFAEPTCFEEVGSAKPSPTLQESRMN